MVLTYIRIKGFGGIVAAEREFGVSITSIYRWKEDSGSAEDLSRLDEGNSMEAVPFLDGQSINGQNLA